MASLITGLCKACNIHRCLTVASRKTSFPSLNTLRSYSIYEPPEINIKPEIPEYGQLWLKFKGHDFALVESYQKYANGLLRAMDINIDEQWPLPTVHTEHAILTGNHPDKLVIGHKLKIPTYQRVTVVNKLPSTKCSILLEALHQNLPEGIDFRVQEPDEDEVENRYIPLGVVAALRKEVEEIDLTIEDIK